MKEEVRFLSAGERALRGQGLHWVTPHGRAKLPAFPTQPGA